ncbi:MAG: hypothetical protein Q9200_007094 [Gallowayella weberi]
MARKKHKTPEARVTVRRTRERFRRRKNSILRKADELAKKCSAEVFVIVRKGDRYFVYNSMEAADFPPPADTILQHPSTEIRGRGDFFPTKKSITPTEESVISDDDIDDDENRDDNIGKENVDIYEEMPGKILIVSLPPTFQQSPKNAVFPV